MITKQKLYETDDGKVHVRNTFDISQAVAKAKEVSEMGARGKNMIPLGYIPPEMWLVDPWLIEASRAAAHGDKYEYRKYVLKFFRMHPEFAVLRSAKYWSGA